MKEIFINVDSYNSEGIKTIKGNNNAEIYKIYVLENKRRLNLTNKTIKLGYVMAGKTNGDVIENLNITNAEQGEITFPITNRISKMDGVYSCQLAISGKDNFLEHTATFTLTVENNIFSDITKAIADSKDFTYLENILDKASKLNEKLKENTSTATNANSNLESNITEANNINSKLLENTSTATSLNKNLESNIDLAKEVKETIKDLDNKNTEATEKIEALTGLNAKATELSNNIQQGLPLNSELVKNVESAKTANNELIATNNDAKAKKTDLDNSLKKTKEFINGLDGSQNIPQLRLDVTELQNGLKSNQALEYSGSSISANDTLEGRTEGMIIKGKTSIIDGQLKSFGEAEKVGDKYKISILSHGQNLCEYLESGSMKSGDFTDYNNNKYIRTNYINIKGITTLSRNIFNYTDFITKGGWYFYDDNKKAILPVKYGDSVSVPINACFVRLELSSKEKGDISSYIPKLNFMVYEGQQSQKLFKPYQSDKKDILIKEPLRSKGDKCDILYEDNGQVKVDRYVEIRKYQEGDEKNEKVITDKVNTVYILDKPATEIVENCVDIDLDTFEEKTYFNIENNIKGSLDFKVPSNIASIVQNTAREVNNIWDVINNLLVPSIVKANGNLAMIKLNNNLN